MTEHVLKCVNVRSKNEYQELNHTRLWGNENFPLEAERVHGNFKKYYSKKR